MNYNTIQVETQEEVAIITINRADKMNALNIETLQDIKAAVIEANSDKGIGVIILTGSGNKAFAAGADIAEFAQFSVSEGTRMSDDGHQVMNTIERSAKPVIAAVNGFALGGGCELSMACHLRIASENARFGQPEINLGLVPGYAGTQRLCEIVGKGRALELLLTADAIKADRALEIGLANQVVSSEMLLETCLGIAKKIMTKSPYAVSRTIACVNAHYAHDQDGYQTEIVEFGKSFGTEDFSIGTKAFLQKEKPKFNRN